MSADEAVATAALFKALADPTRRFLLDRLFQRDGRTLSELESELAMTRFGVMKHLRVLEEAGLVTTLKRGRVRECRLREDALVAVATWTAQQQALWSTRLDALGTLLEDT